jgi:Leucine-rich repeat (LRR) protein
MIRIATIITIIVSCLFQTALADPEYYNYPASSPLITLINPEDQAVHYYHENFSINAPAPGPVIKIDLTGNAEYDIQLDTDLVAIGQTIYLEYNQEIREIIIPDTDTDMDWAQLSIIETIPQSTCRYPGSSPAITVKHPDLPGLRWYHDPIYIETPSYGLTISLDLTNDYIFDVELDCDAAALGKFIHFNNDGREQSFHLSDELTHFPQKERQALIDLYETNGGDNWTNQSNWLGDIDTECTWYGVTCNAEQSHVIELNLEGNNLTGELTSSIGDLEALVTLDLSDNNLVRLREIKEIKYLDRLDLSHNQLSGIPMGINHMDNVTYLNLANNQFEIMSPLIFEMKKLTELRMEGNQLEPIPDGITQLSTLTTGCFSANAIDITDTQIITFLNAIQSDWQKTQTVTPKYFTVKAQTDRTITLQWSVINYTQDEGGYEISYYQANDEGNTYSVRTQSKSVDQIQIVNLLPDTVYYMKIKAFTLPHYLDDGTYIYQTISSPYTDEISVKTNQIPIASLVSPMPVYMASSTISRQVMGNELNAYKYKLNKDNWSLEIPINTPLELSDLTDGPYRLSILGKSVGGFWQDDPTVYEWIVDQTPPAPHIISKIAFTNDQKGVTWEWESSELDCDYRFAADQNQSWTPVGDFVTTTSMTTVNKDGIWYLHLQARDAAGNLGEVVTLKVNAGIPMTERQALIDLYNSTDGDHWNNNTLWLGDIGTECNWSGIICNSQLSHVLEIDFDSGNNLAGAIPDSIQNLTCLTKLNLHSNHISNIPSGIGNLVNLEALGLINNNLKGLPPEIGNLTHLTSLYFQINNYSRFPVEIFNLVNLTRLGIIQSELTVLPADIQNLTKLTHLDLESNKLVDLPEQIGRLTALTHLDLQNNELTALPQSMENLSHLNTLWLHSNQLTDFNFDLQDLESLTLSINQLTDYPTIINNFIRLKHLSLACNTIKVIPDTIGNLTDLEFLDLHLTGIDNIPDTIGNLVKLNHLDLAYNYLTKLPSEIKNLTSLTWLRLAVNELNNMPQMGNFVHLTHLDLNNNHLSSVPLDMDNLEQLTFLDLGRNQYTAISPIFFSLDSLQSLYFNHNKLTQVPSDINHLSHLKELRLEGNKLSSLPREISGMVSLEKADFHANALEITDPTIIQFLDNIQSDWKETQTVYPKEVTVTSKTNTSISLSWTLIDYTLDAGGYEICYRSPNHTFYTTTHNKSVNQIQLADLLPETTYDIKIRTVTDPHNPSDIITNNDNAVYSQYTDEISVTTCATPVAELAMPIPYHLSSLSIERNVMGEQLVAYKYKHNQDNWRSEISIDTPLELTGLEEGNNSLAIIGKSACGFWQDTPSVYEWMGDQTAPQFNILSITESLENQKSLTWTWDASELNCDYRFVMDQNPNGVPVGHFAALTSVTMGNKDGIWYLHLQVRDKAGNISTVKTSQANAGIQYAERKALIDLYNSTDGNNWSNHSGWLGNVGTECSWYGVTCNDEKTHVVTLSMNNNALSGKILASIGQLSALTMLNLSENRLTEVPAQIGNLIQLDTLYLHQNLLASVPSEIGHLINLSELSLYKNDLTDVPSEMNQLTRLERLYLSSNDLSDMPDIGQLTQLTHLYLDNNRLSRIPAGIANLTNLTTLDLSDNNLTSLPPEIKNLVNLNMLDLYNNRLAHVPPEIGNLVNLSTLYLNGNKLSDLPSEMDLLTQLNFVNFNYNALEISDADMIEFLNNLQNDWQSTQTVMPKNLKVTTITDHTISLSWSDIAYQDHEGTYEIVYKSTENDVYTITTINKTMDHSIISGLQPDTTYILKARSVTYAHTSGKLSEQNKNTVYSQFTEEITARIPALPVVQMNSVNPDFVQSAGINYMPSASFGMGITGNEVIAYQYKLNQDDWSEEFNIAEPVTLENLTDGAYRFQIKGKNGIDTWQETPAVYEWIVDTQVIDFSISMSDPIDNSKCMWALESESITFSGMREQYATVTATCQAAGGINISYPEDHTWLIELLDVPPGQHTLTVHATDLAGNTTERTQTIKRPLPVAANITTYSDALLADAESILTITISFVTHDEQQICVNEAVEVNTNLGEIQNMRISEDQLLCDLRADSKTGDATITVKYRGVVLGEKGIAMVPGPADRLVFSCEKAIQKVNSSGYTFSISIEDEYEHPVYPESDIDIKVTSDPNNNALFTYKSDGVIFNEKVEIVTNVLDLNYFLFKSSKTGSFTIKTYIVESDFSLKNDEMVIEVIEEPVAKLTNPPLNISNKIDYTFHVSDANYITHYQYQLDTEDTEAWSSEIEINTPIQLIDLEDGTHTLNIIGKNILGLTQNKQSATTYTWTIDTEPPGITISLDQNTTGKIKWSWSSGEEDCKFRFAVDRNPNWEAEGIFKAENTTAEISGSIGKWNVHVQAEDPAGNISNISTVTASLEPTVQFISPQTNCNEGDYSVTVKIELSYSVDADITVNYQLLDKDIAITKDASSSDYKLPDNPVVTIPAGYTSAEIQLLLVDDDIYENTEGIALELSTTNATPGNNSIHVIYIEDNDEWGISINKSNPTISENGDPGSMTISLTSMPESAVTLSFACQPIDVPQTNSFNATESFSFTPSISFTPTTITFLPETWNIAQSVHLSADNDSIDMGEKIDIKILLKTATNDLIYSNKQISTVFSLEDDDQEPLPGIFCPEKPFNIDTKFKICWKTGGESKNFIHHLKDKPETKSFNTCYTEGAVQSNGDHEFYIKEYNKYTNQWSSEATCEFDIDTGKPKSTPTSPKSAEAQSRYFTITYSYDDDEIDGYASGVAKVELWAATPDDNAYTMIATHSGDSIGTPFDFTATTDGVYRFITCAYDNAGNAEMDQLPALSEEKGCKTIYSNNFSGYAIIVVANGEGIEHHTVSANNIYRHFINRNFGMKNEKELDHIKYFNPNDNTYDGFDDFQKNDYKNELKKAIGCDGCDESDDSESWALKNMKILAGPLYIILIGHGNNNAFYLSGTDMTVTASELNNWINFLEKNIKDKKIDQHEIVIVINSCNSGSFIDELAKKGRIVITSTAADELSFRGHKTPVNDTLRDGAYFASNLFNGLGTGLSISESFVNAVYQVEMLTGNINTLKDPYYDTAAQHPQINFGNDQEGHNSIFNYRNVSITLGYTTSTAPVPVPVEIKDVKIVGSNILAYSETTCEFQVTLDNEIDNEDNDDNATVCVEIRKPSPTVTSKDYYKILDLERVILTHQNEIYTGTFTFDTSGKYTLYFYVEDSNGFITYRKAKNVYKNKAKNEPPASFQLYSPLGPQSVQKLIFSWEETHDQDSTTYPQDSITYSLYLSLNQDFNHKSTEIIENINHMQYRKNFSDSWREKDIFWKVRAIDKYGAYTETETDQFEIQNITDPIDNFVFIHVYDEQTKLPVPNARVIFESYDSYDPIEMTMSHIGHYIKDFDSTGQYKVTIHTEDYYETAIESVAITSGDNHISFAVSVETGDLNKNKIIDIGDAILGLKIISDIKITNSYSKAAVIDENAGLQDILYIFRSVGSDQVNPLNIQE